MRDLVKAARRSPVVSRNIDTILDAILGPVSTFDWFFGDPFEKMQNNISGSITPTYDFGETEDAYHAKFMLAGFNKEEIDIEVDEHSVTIKAEHKEDDNKDDIKYYNKGISEKRFAIKRTFPTVIDIENIKAEHKDGILSCVFPKRKVEEKKSTTKVSVS